MGLRLMRGFPFATVGLSLAVLVSLAVPSRAEEKHCPDNPAGTFRFFDANNPDQDRRRMADVAEVAKTHRLVCLLAWVGGEDLGYSKKLAIRRAIWLRDQLVAHGVPRDVIAVEFRPTSEGAEDKHVDVILDR